MELNFLDVFVFLAFVCCVISLGILKSRKEKTSEGYFLAGRGLSWWLIGFSLIAANISTEQFIGMSGSAAKWLGLAIASYEWMAAITLVVVAFFFLPKFLRSGIYTIPEFLEYRYNTLARTLMALFTVAIYVFVTFAVVVYSGALTVKTLFGVQEYYGISVIKLSCWIIGILAAIYVASGGLKACAWADLLQGSALIVGGALILYWVVQAFDAASVETIPALAQVPDGAGLIEKFRSVNADKLHMFKSSDDPEVPWTALMVGLWLPNFYYWGLNQYIMQRTLGAHSLRQGQKGIVFAASLKLIIPFIIVFPGIMAFNLYSSDMKTEAIDTNKESIEFLKADNVKMEDFDFNASMEGFLKANSNNPAAGKKAFEFDDAFAEIYPEKAKDIIAFNAAILSEEKQKEINEKAQENEKKDWSAGKKLQKHNEALVSAIKEKNEDLPKDDQIEVCQQFIGYKYDSAFALLIKNLVPIGWRGFILAAILGAVMSSLASMLNSASTIFTMDVYNKFINQKASQKTLVLTGRICVGIFAIIGCIVAPFLDDPKFGGVFKYIQEFQGFISPGILAVFVFGFISRKAPPITGVVGLVLCPILYGLIKIVKPELLFMNHELAFLDRMAVVFAILMIVMWVITMAKPRKEPFTITKKTDMDLTSSKGAMVFGIGIVVVTVALYIIFR